MIAATIGLTFPGQGAHDPQMLAGVRGLPAFAQRHAQVCEQAGIDPIRELERGNRGLIERNLLSSLLTVLTSSLMLDHFHLHNDSPAACFGGYSVGQWSALYAAGVLDFSSLVRVVAQRARFMDECVEAQPGGMCAVIGLAEPAVAAVLEELRAEGYPVFISNYNCVGQYSLAGTLAAIEHAKRRLAALKPKKLVHLPMSGAWHSPLLREAEEHFERYLQDEPLRTPSRPVIDNVSGDWLPSDAALLRQALAKHLSHPVRWQQSVRTMIAAGCSQFYEIGYGDTLTKFGFFIDRRQHYYPLYAGNITDDKRNVRNRGVL